MTLSVRQTLSEENAVHPQRSVTSPRGIGAKTAGTSLVDRLATIAATDPNRLAIVVRHSGESITFDELERRSNRLARHLSSARTTGTDRCVAVLMDRSIDFVIAALAIIKSGAAYLPLDAATPAARLNFILSDSGATELLTHRSKTATLDLESRPTIIDLDDRAVAAAIADESADALEIKQSDDSLAYVIYTSGSTGQPKGVEITHANLLNLIDWHNRAFAITSKDRASQVAGLGFDAAVWEIWPHLSAGASLHLADEATRRSAPALREWLIAEKITVSFVPTILAEQLLHGGWPADAALRTMLTGADTLHRRPTAGLPFKLVNNYGPSECTVVATSGVVESNIDTANALNASPSIGRAIDGARVMILDTSFNEVAVGESGELHIAGALVGRGYRNKPAMTAERFVNIEIDGISTRVYRTGDRARQLPDGHIEFLGRLDDQVKIRGNRVELGEIVACLDRCPGVEASAVIARPSLSDDASAGLELVGYVVSAPTVEVVADDLKTFLAARLPEYMIPSIFVKLEILPTTANGKLDRANLPTPTNSNQLLNGTSTQAPEKSSKDLAGKIGTIVAGLLNKPSITPTENFFMAGGHSMFGVQLVSKLREAFGVKLTLRQLFSSPTVDALVVEVTKLLPPAA